MNLTSWSEIIRSDYSDSSIRYIDGFFGPGQLTYLSGYPGSGKSFTAYDMLHSVVTGKPFMGSKINQQANCLLIDCEMGSALCGARIQKMMGEPRPTDNQFYLASNHDDFCIDNRDHVNDLIATIKEHDFGVVLIDSLSKILKRGVSENDNIMASAVGHEFMHIRRETGVAIIVIHHSAKGGDPLRGAGELAAHADNVFVVRAADGRVAANKGKRTIEPIKTRDEHPDRAFRAAFRIEESPEGRIAVLRIDDDPIDLFAAVVNTVKARPLLTSSDIAEITGKRIQAVTDVLKSLVEDGELQVVKQGKKILYQ